MKEFVIYHFDHYSGFSQVLAMRCCWHMDKKAYLICHCDNGEEMKTQIYDRMVQKGIFDKAIVYEAAEIRKTDSVEQMKEKIISLFQEKFEEAQIDLTKAEKIYTSADIFNEFSIYLGLNRCHYSIYELHTGQFQTSLRNEIAYNIGVASKAYRDVLTETYALTGHPQLVLEKILIDYQAEQSMRKTGIMVTVNFSRLLKEIPSEMKKLILSCLELDKSVFQSEQILLPNSLGYTRNARDKKGKQLQDNKLVLPYQILVDYFGNSSESITIKPHPNNVLPFEKAFCDRTVLSKAFSIEFLHLTEDIKLKTIFCISTSALEKIEGLYQKVYEGGMEYFRAWYNMHKFSVALKIAERLSVKVFHQLLTNDNKSVFQLYFNRCSETETLKGMNASIIGGRIFTIFDTCFSNKTSDIRVGLDHATNSINFFIGEGIECFFEKGYIKLLPYCLPIRITKKKASDQEIYSDIDEEIIYMFAKDYKDWELVRSSAVTYNLKYTNLVISAAAFTKQEVKEFQKKIYSSVIAKSIVAIEKEMDNLKSAVKSLEGFVK